MNGIARFVRSSLSHLEITNPFGSPGGVVKSRKIFRVFSEQPDQRTVPSVPAACKGNELLTDAGCSTNGYDNFDKIRFWRTPTAKCESGDCVPYYRWVSDYVGVIGGR